MPPYIRLMAASSLAFVKDVNFRAVSPNSISVESEKLKLSPKRLVKATADALDITLCPLVYSGKGGVCNNGTQFSSMYWLMYVSGLIKRLRYFSSQQEMKPS